MSSTLDTSRGTRRAHLILLGFFVASLVAALLVDNRWIFGSSVAEDGDFGANSLLVTEAKHLSLVTGNYSKFHFNHPGPFYLYIQAIGEVVFHDALGIVAAPYQGQLLSIILLNAATYTLGLYLLFLAGGFRSLTPLLLGWSAFMATAHSVTPAPILGWASLSSTWMPCMYVATFALLLTSAFAFARRVPWATPVLVFSGGALVHGHVSFAAIVPAVAIYALYERIRDGSLSPKTWLPDRGELLASAGVLAIFLAPILYHTVAHFPGEFGRYLSYKAPGIPERGLLGAWRFTVRFLGGAEAFFGVIVALTAVTLRATWSKGDRISSWLRILAAATVLAFLYAWRSVDSYQDDYTLQYLSVVPMLLLSTLVARIADSLGVGIAWSRWVWLIPVALLIAPFGNPYRGSADVAAGVARLRQASQAINGSGQMIGLRFEHGDWPYAMGLLAGAKREGLAVCSTSPDWSFMATIAMTCQRAPDYDGMIGPARPDQAREISGLPPETRN